MLDWLVSLTRTPSKKGPELPSYSPSRGEPCRMHLPKQSGHVLSETRKHPTNKKPCLAACSRMTCPTWPFLLAATRREDVISGEGMSKSTGLERHTYEAMILDLELAKSLLAGAMTSWNPHPLLHRRGDELTCRSDAASWLSLGSWVRMIAEDQEEQGEGDNQDEPQNPIRVLEN